MSDIKTFEIDANGHHVIDKAAGSALDYKFDWTDWLALVGDTIASATVTVDTASGVVKGTVTTVGSIVTVGLSGGTKGKRARVTCRIVTNAPTPRTDERTFFLIIT